MKLADLSTAGRSPALPLKVQLPVGELAVDQWLRVLPGRRYVGRGVWQGRPVLAKLLVGSKARRHYCREREGAGLLAAQGLSTPQLLVDGFRAEAGGWLLFDYLQDSESMANRWRNVSDEQPLSVGQQQVLAAALEAIGFMHSKGLWQDDLHLDNLLWQNNKLYWVDGGTIRPESPGHPLSRMRAAANLGVFFAQLHPVFDSYIEALLEHYRQYCFGIALESTDVLREVSVARRWRINDFLGKLGRDCSLFSARRGPFELRVICRQEAEALQTLMAVPDRFIAEGTILKAGRSATVARVVVDGRMLVVKRYNIKGFAHWLRRCWRPSRAWHSWREGNCLAFFGIPTAKPLAMMEKRFCWLRHRAYLVSEFVKGDNALDRFAPYVSAAPPEAEVAALERLFVSLWRERISHGDMKGSNLIWQSGAWALVDLDAMRRHESEANFFREAARDRTRFLNNWPEDSPLHRLLDERIPRPPDNLNEQRG